VSEPSFLYFDDDLRSREVLEILLAKVMGFPKITMFEDSKDIEERLNTLPRVPDVVFLDIQMKPLNGYQVLEILRSRSDYQNSKIIALTATVMPDDVARFQDVGFDGLIGKPLVHKVFPELVKKILDGEAIWYIP
jgi:two-component system cell cycle response regulator DivK